MLRIGRTTLALALSAGLAGTAGAAPDQWQETGSAWRHVQGFPALAEVLDSWLDAHSSLARRDHPPRILTITPARAALLAGRGMHESARTRGLYDPETATIYLIHPWNPKRAADVSVLLHELVHHRQAPHHFYCPGAQEEAAYRLQDRWLRARGLRADVNWIAVVLEAGCTPRDIHPD